MTTIAGSASEAAREQVAGVRRWYHSIEVAAGVVTPGWFDLRPIVNRLPWPDVRGKRCLDVGTSDGFLAFELERRGASEVVAVDIAGHDRWDWELRLHELGPAYLRNVEGETMGGGFQVARSLLDSSVALERTSVYELDPATIGIFDIVVCGSLLLHLRDPLRALAAIRSVCGEALLLTNQVDLRRSLVPPDRPLIRLDGTSGLTQWWLPTPAGNRQMLLASGFSCERESRLYCIPYGAGHPPRSRRLRSRLTSLVRSICGGCDGIPHHALLARPARTD